MVRNRLEKLQRMVLSCWFLQANAACWIQWQNEWRSWFSFTHWGWMTHICVGNLTITGSDNGLWPVRRQAIIWTYAGILLIGPLGTNFSEILNEMHTFSFKKMHLKMSSRECVNHILPCGCYAVPCSVWALNDCFSKNNATWHCFWKGWVKLYFTQISYREFLCNQGIDADDSENQYRIVFF